MFEDGHLGDTVAAKEATAVGGGRPSCRRATRRGCPRLDLGSSAGEE